MNEYIIFEKKISISKAAIRCYEMQYAAVGAVQIIGNRFREWYDSCGNIKAVLREYPQKVNELCISLVAETLYDSLVGIGIYDQGKEEYLDQCVDLTEPDEAYNAVAEQYNAICGDRDAAFAYRKARRQSRPRVGIIADDIYSMYGAALDAGVINLTTGAIHGVRNTIGNIGSSIAAAANIRKLYNDNGTYSVLLSGVISCVFTCFTEHMAIVNEAKAEDYYRNDFDDKKADALFESAKKVPQKEQELLLASFQMCPWNRALYEYIFIHYPQERKNIIEIGKQFHVDFSDVIKEACYAEYDEDARSSQKKAEKAKAKIQAIVSEYGFDNEDIVSLIDRIDYDCLSRIGVEYGAASLELRPQIVDKFNAYDAKDDTKAVVAKEARIWEIAKKYNVVFTADETEEIISAFCDRFCKGLGYKDTIAKVRVIMKSLSVKESKALDDFERRIISEHGDAYLKRPIGRADAIIKKVDQCEISDKIKRKYIYENDIWELFEKYHIGLSKKSKIDVLYRLCEKEVSLSGCTFEAARDRAVTVADTLRALNDGSPMFDYEKKDPYLLEQIARKIRPLFAKADLYGSNKIKYTNHGIFFATEREREDTLWVYGDQNFAALLNELVANLPEKVHSAADEEIVLIYTYQIGSSARKFFFITTERVYGFRRGWSYHGSDIGNVTDVSSNGVLGVKNDSYLIDVFSTDDGRCNGQQLADAFNKAINQVIRFLKEKERKKRKLKKFYDQCPPEESDECDSANTERNETAHPEPTSNTTKTKPSPPVKTKPSTPVKTQQPKKTSEKGSDKASETAASHTEEKEKPRQPESVPVTPNVSEMPPKETASPATDDWLMRDLGLFQKGISNMTVDELNRAIVALTVKHNTSRYHAVGSETFNKKIAKAKAAYAPYTSDERLLLMEDQTIFESAKDGFVLTNKTLYVKFPFKKKKTIPLSTIRGIVSVYERLAGQTYLYVVTADGKHEFSSCLSEKDVVCYEGLMRELLQLCGVGDQAPSPTETKPVPANKDSQNAPQPVSTGWTCECGNSNKSGNFCSHCGKKRILPATWLCSCGNENKGNFCSECGAPRPKNPS